MKIDFFTPFKPEVYRSPGFYVILDVFGFVVFGIILKGKYIVLHLLGFGVDFDWSIK